ncbi:aspartic proteinase-like protein 1 [Dendrobium catenatum]|uniref:aspartic proteinase-like protein 1 n=1 Tax=Dendrobium catenatum TaxID=906689 RepID=UPI0009F3E56D|nr:aspartic proteinase-like protein 1 [Dendrobium catenatum]
MPSSPLLFFLLTFLVVAGAEPLIFSSPMVHRFSEEARRAAAAVPAREVGWWPALRSPEYYEVLVRSDRVRQRRRLGGAKYSMLYPAEGSETLSLGNDFGWLHYTWVDVGTPNVSFLVALDAGSDLFWVPCDCIKCAPLSGYHGSLEKELGMYNPDESKTSKHLSCSHELCTLGGSCSSSKQPCPYTVNYYSENTSTSGLLVEDTIYLAKTDDHSSIKAPVILGCGRKQSGGYLDGIAPDGLLGLGFGEISVPSILAKAGFVRNSFSMCFRGDDSGRIFFGDQGVSTQHSTPFVALDGKYVTYIIGVEKFCVGSWCFGKTSFQALVDSGSSFTFLPEEVYRKVTLEFDRQINASRLDYDGSPWEYCYSANALEAPQVPSITLTFSVNESFEVINPIFSIYDKEEHDLAGFCIALQSSAESIGTIGQNFMTGYHMVFDRENLKLGWSRSDCHNLDNSTTIPLTSPPHSTTDSPLPTNQQQSSPNGREVTPAIAGRAPSTTSAASPQEPLWFCSLFLFLSQFFLSLVV